MSLLRRCTALASAAPAHVRLTAAPVTAATATSAIHRTQQQQRWAASNAAAARTTAVKTPNSAAATATATAPASAPASAAASSVASSPRSESGPFGADGPHYWLRASEIAAYHRDGYLSLAGFLSEPEILPIESVYSSFMNREIPVPGRDFCDMSAADFNTPFEEWNLINAMLPSRYHPALRGNLFEVRAAHVVRQLFPAEGDRFGLDYDQLLAKKPGRSAAVFAWHADMAYWPLTRDTRTATFSLALDSTTRANGCLRFVPGSHLTQTIRKHKPLNSDRSKAHAIACEVLPDEPVVHLEIPRGGVTIHNEFVVHGSGGNETQGWRRTYVAAFRSVETIAQERAAGFTHSHNDEVNWDTFNQWDKQQ